jgi:hypothetical protein
MIINLGKTKEIVFHRPRLCFIDLQPSFCDIKLADEVKLLGINLNGTLTFNKISTSSLPFVISVVIR